MATVWAAIEPASGNKYYQALQATSSITGMVRIRYRSDIRSTWRIKFGERILTIVDIIDVKEQRSELQIAYKELQD
jgi:SPP1 family predicted phage head-tail adaptor